MTCLDRNSHCANVFIFTICICNFSNFVALCTDDTEFPAINVLEIFGGYVLISPISSNVSSVEHDVDELLFYSLRRLFL